MPLIFIFSAVLRIRMVFLPKSLWFDEWESVEMALKPCGELIRACLQDTHPPLYFLILKLIVFFFGMDNEMILRLPSLLAGIGAVGVIYFLAKEMFDEKIAKLSALLAGISPYFLHLSQEIRNHGLPLFFILAATLAWLKMRKEKRLTLWGSIYVGSALAALYTEHFTWFWLAVIFFCEIMRGWQQARRQRMFHIALIVLALPALFFFLVHYGEGDEFQPLWVLSPRECLRTIKEALSVYWFILCGPHFFVHWLSSLKEAIRTSPVFWLAGVLFLWSIRRVTEILNGLRREKRAIFNLFSLTIFFPILLVALVNPTRLDARYFSFAAAFIMILLAHGFFQEKNAWKRGVWLVIFIFVSADGAGFMASYPADVYHRDDYRGMTAYVFSHAQSQDAVCYSNRIIDHYIRVLRLPVRAKTLPSLHELYKMERSQINAVWLLEGIPESSRRFKGLRKKMARLGFNADSQELKFGGEDQNTIVNMFQRSRK